MTTVCPRCHETLTRETIPNGHDITGVSPDYSEVRLWLDTEPFDGDPLPRTVDEYMSWIDVNLDFVERRNRRISDLSRSTGHRNDNVLPCHHPV